MQMIRILEMQIANGRVRSEDKSLWNMSVNNDRQNNFRFFCAKINMYSASIMIEPLHSSSRMKSYLYRTELNKHRKTELLTLVFFISVLQLVIHCAYLLLMNAEAGGR